MSAPSSSAASRRVARGLILGLVFFCSYAYFYEGGGWNQNTRFDLVRAIVERHTLRIDAFHENTGDKAQVGEHYYADKAPGASLTAVPAVAAVRAALRVLNVDPLAPRTIEGLSYVATLAGAAVPAALAGACVFWICVRFGVGETGAGIAAIACALGTPLFAYATILYGHALAAGCLTAAFLAALSLPAQGGGAHDARRAWLLGIAAGWAVVTEFPASIPAMGIVVAGVWRLAGVSRARHFGAIAALGIGLSIPAATLLIYNRLAFGSFFHIGYTSEAGYEAMRTGIFGVGWPKAGAAYELLFGSYRGLLPLAPILLVAPIGYWSWLTRSQNRSMSFLAGGIAVYYFILTAGYAYWDGGWSYGSRHLGPALPFLALGIGAGWDRVGPTVRWIVVALLLVSVGQSLVAVATTSQPPGAQPVHPMRDLLWPAFVSGEFPIGTQSVLELRPPPMSLSEMARSGVPRASWNVGQRLGLHGHASLIPLGIIWLAGAIAWRRTGVRWRTGDV